MELKLKFLSFIRAFRFKKLRRTNALIDLYNDYIEFLKKDTVAKIDEKVSLYREDLYRKFQTSYYDEADEREIFNTVFNHKYEELKKKYRLKFRAYRESTRRKIAKLNPDTQLDLINQLKESINLKEIEINAEVEKIAESWKLDFETQNASRISKNPPLNDIKERKKDIEYKLTIFRQDTEEALNKKLEVSIEKCEHKIVTLKNKLPKINEKLKLAIEKYDVEYSKRKELTNNEKIVKLQKEIEKHTSLKESAEDEKTIEREIKILNSLTSDLEFLRSTTSKEGEVIANDEVLAIDNLCMYFGGIKAVNKLSFTVKNKEIFGLIGPNGAGKTTVFNCITQFYKPTAGTIYLRNKNNEVVDLTKEVVHDVILQGVVRTFQNLEVIKDITVLDNLLVAAHRNYTSNFFQHMFHTRILKVEESVIRERAIKVLKFMGILKYKDMYAWGLPYGILKKIEIARTLMCNPQLIILDEPAAGLNDTETAELSELIHRIRDEYDTTILLVEHDMGLVMDVCDRICAISFGNLLALGTPTEIQQNKAVQEAYLGVSED